MAERIVPAPGVQMKVKTTGYRVDETFLGGYIAVKVRKIGRWPFRQKTEENLGEFICFNKAEEAIAADVKRVRGSEVKSFVEYRSDGRVDMSHMLPFG